MNRTEFTTRPSSRWPTCPSWCREDHAEPNAMHGAVPRSFSFATPEKSAGHAYVELTACHQCGACPVMVNLWDLTEDAIFTLDQARFLAEELLAAVAVAEAG